MQQQQSVMAAYAAPSQMITDHIQKYLDENKQLILAILDNQNSGKPEQSVENQAKLQRNLMYLAAIADSQPQMPTIAQYGPSTDIQSGTCYMQHQQYQQMTPQSLMAARSPMLYAQPPTTALQQQQHQAALHSQLSMSCGGNTGFNMLHPQTSSVQTGGVFPDFGRSSGAGKQDSGNSLSVDGHGSNSGGQSRDGTEPLFSKGTAEDGN